jgi:hypothetical protein
MANHARNQLRDLVVARLAGLPTSGARVYRSRVFQMTDNTVPGLIVYSLAESVEHKSIGTPRLQRRTLTFLVECYAKLTNGVEDVLDTMCKEVEAALAADPSLGNKVRDLHLADTAVQLDDADRAIGVAQLTWTCIYNLREGAPDQLLT